MILEITKNTDAIWKLKFKNISKVDSKVKSIVKDMRDTLDFTGGVGLAAPQAGIPVRIFIVNYGRLKETFINPKVVEKTKLTNESEEGCLSVPGFRGLVHRSNEITINYLDLKGKKKSAKLTSYYARIVQHEFDHLDSTFYVDRITNKSKKLIQFSPIRIVFFGTPEFGAIVLRSIVGQAVVGEYKVLMVVTQPESASGRGKKVKESEVHLASKGFGIPAIQPLKLNDKSFAQQIKKLKPDVLIVASYGQILPKSILDIPKYGSVNIHSSLLPKYRGASPIQSAILFIRLKCPV